MLKNNVLKETETSEEGLYLGLYFRMELCCVHLGSYSAFPQ